jgi:hypothetical protein
MGLRLRRGNVINSIKVPDTFISPGPIGPTASENSLTNARNCAVRSKIEMDTAIIELRAFRSSPSAIDEEDFQIRDAATLKNFKSKREMICGN